jgi:hypothetical protein
VYSPTYSTDYQLDITQLDSPFPGQTTNLNISGNGLSLTQKYNDLILRDIEINQNRILVNDIDQVGASLMGHTMDFNGFTYYGNGYDPINPILPTSIFSDQTTIGYSLKVPRIIDGSNNSGGSG